MNTRMWVIYQIKSDEIVSIAESEAVAWIRLYKIIDGRSHNFKNGYKSKFVSVCDYDKRTEVVE